MCRVVSAAHQVRGVTDLLDDAFVPQELQGEPEGQRAELLPRQAGGESGRQRLRARDERGERGRHATKSEKQPEIITPRE